MTWLSAIVVYVCAWWLVFFMMLPIGVRPPHEVGETAEPGHEAGAPVRPHLGKKVLAATLVAAVVSAAIFWVVESDMITFRGG